MDEADIAIVFTDEKTFAQKKLQPYAPDDVKQSFKKSNILVYNQPELLLNYLENINIDNTSLLLMSSGNFGGIDIVNLAETLVNKQLNLTHPII